MSTGKCHRGVTWSCDSWWNPAILLDLSMLCWSDYNSCLKSLVSSKTNFFVIVQRGISKTSLKQLDVVLLSTSDSVKLYQFTTQVAPPFGEQYLQEGFWQLTEYLVADPEILRKTPTWFRTQCWNRVHEMTTSSSSDPSIRDTPVRFEQFYHLETTWKETVFMVWILEHKSTKQKSTWAQVCLKRF